MNLERNFKNKVTDDLKILNGEEFERFSRYILELELNEKVIHKGQNLFAKPVGYTADFADVKYEIIGQSGTNEGYFDDFKKPYKDIKAAIKNHKLVKIIYLFSNRYAGTSRLGNLIESAKNNNITQEIIPFDSERIAELILDKIIASYIIDKIFEFLPSAFELYKILPKTSQIPSHKGKYYERNEELEIIKKLKEESVIQLYGLSGIGKTEITIGVAQKLIKKYDTIIWIEGDSVQNSIIDFNAIKISKFDKLINLASVLESYSVCVIFDNINNNTSDIKDSFIKYNKKNSVCIMSSLTRSLTKENSIKLNDISNEIAEKILFEGNPDLENDKRSKILSYTGKHPLILKILSSSIKNQLLDWDSLIIEFGDLNRLNDTERNQTISNRIIGKIKKANEKELFALNFIDNRFITQSFLEKLIGRIGISKLIDNSILDRNDIKFYSTHQIILDSIKTELTTNKWLKEFTFKVKEYLLDHNEIKDIGFYNAMYNHRNLFDKLYDITEDVDLKRIILYSLIQSTDITINNQIDVLINKIPNVISENTTYYENLLSIELMEINLTKVNKKIYTDIYIYEAEKAIDKLNEFINIAEQKSHKISILHHIGKFYFKIEKEDLALKKFEEVLNLSPNDPFALLQIARIACKSRNSVEVTRILKIIFELQNCPLPILLSFYEMIVYNNLENLRRQYIDEKIDFFISNIINAIDSRYDQPYKILGKISSHLSYNFPIYFETIIDNLSIPANVDFSESLRFNFAVTLLGALKFFKYNGDLDANKIRMDKIFKLANANFELANLDSDYKKSQYVELLIEVGEFDLAEIQAKTFEEENEFNYQKWSKIYRGQKQYEDAIKAAENAISFKNVQEDKYLSAFFNDKAEAENGNGMKCCINTLRTAIEKQNNPKTKQQWSEKLADWNKNNTYD